MTRLPWENKFKLWKRDNISYFTIGMVSTLRLRISYLARIIWRCLKHLENRYDLVLLLINPYFIPKKLLRDALQRETAQVKGNLVVDVGCGWQPYKIYFKHFDHYVGLDLDANRHPTVVSTADCLPLSNRVVDVIICTEVIEHTREPKQVCCELARVLKPGGGYFLSAPMSWNLHYEPYDYYRFTRYGLVYLMEEAGLEVEKVIRIGGLFSLFGARLVDVVQRKVKSLPLINRIKGSIVLAGLIVAPLNAAFFVLGSLLDGLDSSDAIGWVVVASKPNGCETTYFRRTNSNDGLEKTDL